MSKELNPRARYKRRRGAKDDASAKPTELAGHLRNESARAVFIMKYDPKFLSRKARSRSCATTSKVQDWPGVVGLWGSVRSPWPPLRQQVYTPHPFSVQ